MLQNYSELSDLQPMTIFVGAKEIEGEFTNLRVDRDSLGEGRYAYDLQEGEDGEFCALRGSVVVNHGGTFITNEEINLGPEGCLELGEGLDNDYSF